MSTVTSPPPPHCPHCNAGLTAVSLYNWIQPQWVILCVNCPACLKVLHLQVVPVAIQEASRVQIPS